MRAAKVNSQRIMSKWQREENIHAIGRLVTKHEGLLRQALSAKERMTELRGQHPFLTW